MVVLFVAVVVAAVAEAGVVGAEPFSFVAAEAAAFSSVVVFVVEVVEAAAFSFAAVAIARMSEALNL